jgi:hypothetical protein
VAGVLRTRDGHLLGGAVVEYCAGQGIQVMNEVELCPLADQRAA